MKINYDDLENAYHFVSSDQKFMNSAILCRETGKIYYISGMGDADELPDDVDDPDRYIGIPHKKDLDLGLWLIEDFVAERLPDSIAEVTRIFQHKGAYSRYKSLLESKGLLDEWYNFENTRTREALMEWCTAQGIEAG